MTLKISIENFLRLCYTLAVIIMTHAELLAAPTPSRHDTKIGIW